MVESRNLVVVVTEMSTFRVNDHVSIDEIVHVLPTNDRILSIYVNGVKI